MTSVLIADDHLLFTDLVGAFLLEHGLEIAGVARSAPEALARARECRPDICLVEAAGLAEGPATSFVTRLARVAPHTRVVVLTGSADDPGPAAAAAAGAAGHLRKSASGDEVLDAIRRVARGETGVGTAGSGPADARDPRDQVDATMDARHRMAGLRARERECLELIVRGASTEEMAATMGVTVATVRSHVRAVLATLGVHSRLGAASYALRHGLVRPVSRVG